MRTSPMVIEQGDLTPRPFQEPEGTATLKSETSR